MKVTTLAIVPPAAASTDPKLTPELLAATLAKYSRNNLGIDQIISKIDLNNCDASVEGVFKFVDYGHASIGGLTGGIAVAIDNISLWLAYKMFEIMPVGDGQECSTRYITMDPSQLVELPDSPFKKQATQLTHEAVNHYTQLVAQWSQFQKDNPEATRINPALPEKVRMRMSKNFALDRARYLLPLNMSTNMAFVATARIWVEAIRHLTSLPQPEAQQLGEQLRVQITKYAPKLMRHSTPETSFKAQGQHELDASLNDILTHCSPDPLPSDSFLHITSPQVNPFMDVPTTITNNFDGKVNRYSRYGPQIRRTSAHWGWNNVALAELRDLNRHRTGSRYSLLSQRGFYYGPQEVLNIEPQVKTLIAKQITLLKALANQRDPNYVYTLLLGSQSPFERVSTLDKLIYEIELRTGMGSHYRYAEHYTDIAKKLLIHSPNLTNHVIIGTAEPE